MDNAMKKAVVVDCDYGSVTREELLHLQKKLYESKISLRLCHCQTEEEIISAAKGAELILGTGNPALTKKVLERLPNLKAILRFGIGVNSIDLETATAQGIAVMNMPGFCTSELAVHAASLALALNRNVLYYDSRIRKGQWPKAQYYVPRSPQNLTLGLYGFGGSAKELYRIFHFGFGSRVIACDPFIPEEEQKKYEVEFVEFETLLRETDILSLHVPLTEHTRHVFCMDVFRKMKNDAILINVSRGELIHQQDLAAALEQGEIRFAGLDVFEQEPLESDSPLLKKDNVILTCHSAFYGVESKKRQLTWAYKLTELALNQRTLRKKHIANQNVIPKLTGYIFQ